MTAESLLASLEAVRPRGTGRWSARCPHHSDKSPSLSISEGDRGILLKCWAGCSVEDITSSLGIRTADLFFDAGLNDSAQQREARRQRAQERAARQGAYESRGRRLDALREAAALIQSAQGISIGRWSDDRLNVELNRLGNAYDLLESEGWNE